MTRSSSRFERVPDSTYRVQLTPDFGFAAAEKIVPYLTALGITDLYCSPVLTSRHGSTHGYDVVDPLHLNPELGGQEAFDRLVRTLHDHEMGLLLDIVPNHMAASSENLWWRDVLENGPSSRFAHFFDIEWDRAGPSALENRVLLPILDSPYGETLEHGDIQIESDPSGYHLRYADMHLPLSTVSYRHILERGAAEIERAVGSTSDDWAAYSRLLKEISLVPSRAESDPVLIARRLEVRDLLEHELPRLRTVPAIGREIEKAVEVANGTPGVPRSFDILDQIISGQAYRLAFWQLARERINYRRFFDVNDLISMRVEDEDVFRAVHQRVLQLLDDGDVTGFRVDHVDGLWDPEGYLHRLQQAREKRAGEDRASSKYIVVEKILAAGERLPDSWPVAGTTGYEFMNVLSGLMTDPEGIEQLGLVYQRMSEMTTSFPDLVYQAKIQVLDESFAANVQSLSGLLVEIAEHDRYGRDLTLSSLRQSISEVSAALPVYRTYINGMTVDESEQRWIDMAIDAAAVRRPDLRHALAFLRRVLLLQVPPYIDVTDRPNWLNFVMRWQQLTGPAMAKGNEDTALYQYNRLLSFNEVGGNPDSSGKTIADWHEFNAQASRDWPHTLNATSTHDTKRSEDVRARIAVLTEMPDEWSRRVAHWQELNAGKKPVRDGVPIPDVNVEFHIYETMLGAWPNDPDHEDDFATRLKAYLTKAAREAKLFTSWSEVDEVYESALHRFVDTLFESPESTDFQDDFREFQRLISRAGAINSLSQTLLKLTAPGVPDIYQGTELWDYSLVDPDNRRPVEYETRRRLIAQFRAEEPEDWPSLATIIEDWTDGRIKLFLTQRALRFRREHTRLFTDGDYVACATEGPLRDHIIAFARRDARDMAVVVASRLSLRFVHNQSGLSLAGRWDQTCVHLPDDAGESLVDAFSGRRLDVTGVNGQRRLMVNDVLSQFPCGLLMGTVQASQPKTHPRLS